MHRGILLAPALSCVVAAFAVACGSSGSDGNGTGDDAATTTDGAGSGDGTATDGASMDGTTRDGSSDGATGPDGATTDASTDAQGAADTGATHDAHGPDSGMDGAPTDGGADGSLADTGAPDGGSGDSGPSGNDGGVDSGSHVDSGGPVDAGSDASSGGVVTGGPCASGAAGATAVRVKWIDAAGTADTQWLVEGMPDRSNDMAGTYGYTIPFTPQYVDMFLAQGGVGLDSSDFIDISTSTVGISTITTATLSVYGRSYDVSTNGSFNWQTFDGTGATPTDFVSNVPPYQWYSADMTTEIGPGENNVLIRIKAGPSSGALVVNEVELCLVAQ